MTFDHLRIWNRALGALAVTTALSTGVVAAESDDAKTQTPIKHLVVIFLENHTFDNYFATYPNAANPKGEPAFVAADGTPTVNGLTAGLLTDNPNAANPQRLDRVKSDLVTCSNDHGYTDEQKAVDRGLMDKFNLLLSCTDNLALDYYDGNTVTALWNYAQRFALNDNSFGTTFGPSTPGAINLISGQTHAIGTFKTLDDAAGDLKGDVLLAQATVIGDPDPIYDDCGSPDQAGFEANGALDNHNIGDLLNKKGVSWGWFQGGFAPTSVVGGTAVCAKTTMGHPGVDPGNPADTVHNPISAYSAHHDPFMYYKHSANPHHLPPISPANVSKTDQAMHQYELSLFFDAVDNGRMPAVSYLKPARAGRPSEQFGSPVRADVSGRHDQPSAALALLGQHRRDHRLGRFRRLVRPRHGSDPDPVERAQRRCRRRQHLRHPCSGRLSWALRLRPPPAAACCVALGQAKFCRPHDYRSDLDPAVYRG